MSELHGLHGEINKLKILLDEMSGKVAEELTRLEKRIEKLEKSEPPKGKRAIGAVGLTK